MKRKKLLLLAGTRPEIIKLAPFIWSENPGGSWETRFHLTGQHREMGRQIAGDLGLKVDRDYDLMVDGQTPTGFLSRALTALEQALEEWRPDWVAVQGDTTTALAGALAAFYAKIPVLHVEAGLRTGDDLQPFPEEMHRRTIAQLSCAHAAPTEESRAHLLKENIHDQSILVSGNTGIDCLLHVVRKGTSTPPGDRRRVLVTIHRRENHGEVLRGLAGALANLARSHPNTDWILPVHPNPEVRGFLESSLSGIPNLFLITPQPYRSFASLMAHSSLILTDSGGIQEEAPALGIPVLILRNTTERPESVACGGALLVGTAPENIIRETTLLLSSDDRYSAMAKPRFPYGDGLAATRILEWLEQSPGFPPRHG